MTDRAFCQNRRNCCLRETVLATPPLSPRCGFTRPLPESTSVIRFVVLLKLQANSPVSFASIVTRDVDPCKYLYCTSWQLDEAIGYKGEEADFTRCLLQDRLSFAKLAPAYTCVSQTSRLRRSTAIFI